MKPFLSYRSLLLFVLVFAGSVGRAQDSTTTRFIDSLGNRGPGPSDSALADTTGYTSTIDTVDSVTADEPPVDTAIVSNLRPVSADTLALIKKDKGFYYQHWLDSLLKANDANMKVTHESTRLRLPNLEVFFMVFKLVLWLLAAAVLFFVLYKLFLGKNRLFVTNRKNIAAVVEIEAESVTGQYGNLINKAVAENNYRLAVRYLYLQTLVNLSEKGYIVRGTEKTNYQYISELRARSGVFAQPFARLTLQYEYSWYGEYPVSEAMFNTLQHSFNEFNKQTGNL
ncbi:MAG: DUF4129 domain-containing protein [Bacteroidota bacterium]